MEADMFYLGLLTVLSIVSYRIKLMGTPANSKPTYPALEYFLRKLMQAVIEFLSICIMDRNSNHFLEPYEDKT
jgi:hypothetical protein